MTGPPLAKTGTETPRWDDAADLIIVGFGGAGACAAIEAADNGARVLVTDRFTGGGATVRSGGVIYAGGGTHVQRSAGFRDSPASMFSYLSKEIGGGVDVKAVRAFCAASPDNLSWLEKLGIAFPETFYQDKTTQPPGGYGLYFSGNEKQYTPETPCPRGHVPAGAGMTGKLLYQALRKGAIERGARVRYRCRADRLIMDGERVTGVEARELNAGGLVAALHSFLFYLAMAGGVFPRLLKIFENRFGKTVLFQARNGVIITAGGFIYNRGMVHEFAPAYAGCMPLGTPGDDGSGITLGRTAGAAAVSLDACAASRFYSPPEAFVSGILVNDRGERFCDESLYGATLSRHISLQPGGRARLIIDGKILGRARMQMKREERLRDSSFVRISSGEMNALIFRKAMYFINRRFNRKKADSIDALEKKCGMPAGALARTIAEYNENNTGAKTDPFGKPGQYLETIDTPPLYAIDCRLDSRIFPSPCITLGGIRVDPLTGRALKEDGSPVIGLYAAGRSAAGVCSRSYVSGLSLADCVFSGRIAGKSAALVQTETKKRMRKNKGVTNGLV